jgi:hypothetical protein
LPWRNATLNGDLDSSTTCRDIACDKMNDDNPQDLHSSSLAEDIGQLESMRVDAGKYLNIYNRYETDNSIS